MQLNNIIYNEGKHHLSTILSNIYIKAQENKEEFIQKVQQAGDGILDIYMGKLTTENIKREILEKLSAYHVHDKATYEQFLQTHGKIVRQGYYYNLALSDTTIIILRAGDQEQGYIHIHPARYSPNTLRVPAKAFRTAVLSIYLSISNQESMDIALINKARSMLQLPPIDKKSNKIFEIINFFLQK
ncbi:MAG TPA: hypothetical protein PLB63_05900 [Planctomycetota bacterium]|jgi:HSP90 family molecular chaperone|nr:hypothetical protein [Planctomycetota bacterium]HQB00622.1 hypothetical protein [Planctomycetota bacterium]